MSVCISFPGISTSNDYSSLLLLQSSVLINAVWLLCSAYLRMGLLCSTCFCMALMCSTCLVRFFALLLPLGQLIVCVVDLMSLLRGDLISLLVVVISLLSIIQTGVSLFSGIAGLSLAVDDGFGCLPFFLWFRCRCVS
jgi:hypothetical protein